MIAEVISVGTELLLGQIVDTDAVYIAKTLSSLGISIYHRTTVGDNPQRLLETITTAASRADIIITIGGLGPTMDDLTKEIAAKALNIPLVQDEAHLTWLHEIASPRARALPDSFYKQALVPSQGSGIPNPNGTALGSLFQTDPTTLICLPGPPNELIPMVEQTLVPYLSERTTGARTILKSRVLRLVGLGEPLVEDKIKHLMQSDNPSVAPYAKTGEVHLRITAKATSEQEAAAVIADREAAIRHQLQPWIYGVDDETLEFAVVTQLLKAKVHVAAAESCTGGLIAKRITDIPDASKIFDLGIVAYSNESKMNLLGVQASTLEAYGAVSPQTAAEMAIGIRKLAGANVGVSSTGIAGPGGGTAEKPVGTVYTAIATTNGVVIEHNIFLGQRTHVATRGSQSALALVRSFLTAPETLNFERAAS